MNQTKQIAGKQEVESILRALPDTYSEAELGVLEGLVTRYQQCLEATATAEFNSAFYLESLNKIEGSLRDSRYGHEEHQRERAFAAALSALQRDLESFIRFHEDV